MSIKPCGRVVAEYKVERPIIQSIPDTSGMTAKEAIKHLRNLPINEGEQFPWALVEKFATDETNKKRNVLKELPSPQDGYQWVWVSTMYALSGIGGWLEVDLPNKKQGRFWFCCMS